MVKADMRSQSAATATDLLENDDRIAILLADISTDRFEKAFADHPRRIINVGIMEQALVGIAAGFALEGFYPIVHTLAPFLVERPFEQIKLDFGYQGTTGCFVSSGGSYDYATEGGTHHAPGDVQALLSIPSLDVAVPGHPAEVDRLIRDARNEDRLAYIRTSVSRNDAPRRAAFGQIDVLKTGAAATVLAIGPMLDRTIAASSGMDVSVLYASSVRPFDATILSEFAARSPTVIVVEPFYEGTTTSILAEALSSSLTRIIPIGVRREFIRTYGSPHETDRIMGLDATGIHQRIARILD